MRRPTPDHVAFDWWRRAIAGERPPVIEGEPQCGYFRTRMVKGGPWCSARIWIERDVDPETGELTGPEEYRAEINGESRDPCRIWISLRPITEEAYHALMEAHSHDSRFAATHAPVDILEPVRPFS